MEPGKVTFNDVDLVANELNDFFGNIGPILVKEIITLRSNDGVVNYNNNVNKHSMSLKRNYWHCPVTDYNEADMSLVKNIIDCAVKPIKHFVNQSVQAGNCS